MGVGISDAVRDEHGWVCQSGFVGNCDRELGHPHSSAGPELTSNGPNLRLFRNPPNFVLTTKIPPDLVCAARLHLLILKTIECYCLQVNK
jgi:hypothetical protein